MLSIMKILTTLKMIKLIKMLNILPMMAIITVFSSHLLLTLLTIELVKCILASRQNWKVLNSIEAIYHQKQDDLYLWKGFKITMLNCWYFVSWLFLALAPAVLIKEVQRCWDEGEGGAEAEKPG